MQFENVTALAKANIYFDGNVISHTIIDQDGSRKTLGVILAGSYHFGTDAPELMEIVDGSCSVTIDGAEDSKSYESGASFEVPGKSGFTISVPETCEYVCSFLS